MVEYLSLTATMVESIIPRRSVWHPHTVANSLTVVWGCHRTLFSFIDDCMRTLQDPCPGNESSHTQKCHCLIPRTRFLWYILSLLLRRRLCDILTQQQIHHIQKSVLWNSYIHNNRIITSLHDSNITRRSLVSYPRRRIKAPVTYLHSYPPG